MFLLVLRSLPWQLKVVVEVDEDADVAVIQGKDVDAKKRVNAIVFNMVRTIIHQINIGTSSEKLSGIRLLILHLLLPPPVLFPLYKFFRQTMSGFFSSDCPGIPIS